MKWSFQKCKKRGAIKLTFKKGERIGMKNYRPLTLLNLDLKLIHQNQTCVPGRHIEDHTHSTKPN